MNRVNLLKKWLGLPAASDSNREKPVPNVTPHSIAVKQACDKARGEDDIRDAVRGGMSATAACKHYGLL